MEGLQLIQVEGRDRVVRHDPRLSPLGVRGTMHHLPPEELSRHGRGGLRAVVMVVMVMVAVVVMVGVSGGVGIGVGVRAGVRAGVRVRFAFAFAFAFAMARCRRSAVYLFT